MITENNKLKLETIVANLSKQDYLANNPIKNGKKVHKQHRPYGLSGETIEALEMYKMACAKEVSIEEEEMVKDFLLKVWFGRPHLLEK